MKPQIIFIGGGTSFRNKEQALAYFADYDIQEKSYTSWSDWLAWSLGDTYEFIKTNFPVRDNADFDIWSLVFKKYETTFRDDIVIIAYSLGTIFVLKYLLLQNPHYNIKQIHLISSIVDDKFQHPDDAEGTGTFTLNLSELSQMQDICADITIWHSKDDALCNFENSAFLASVLPNAKIHTFENRGHFFQSTFPELYDNLR